MGRSGKKRTQASKAPSPSGPSRWYVVLALIAVGAALVFWLLRPPPTPIPDPDTAGMEPQVADTIRLTRERVADARRDAARWAELGTVLQAHEIFFEAAAAYAEARVLDPEDFRWAYLEAQCRKELRELDAARSAVSAAIALRASYAPLYVLQAELHELAGEDSKALASYRKAAEVDPQCAPAAFGVGRLLFAAGDVEASTRHLETAARLAPESGAVQAALARLYRRMGDRERALAAASLARELHPEVPLDDPVMAAVAGEAVSVVGLQSRAVDAENRGDTRGAEALLRRMIGLRPEEANLYYNLANNLSRQRRFEEAEAEYRNALERHPEHVSALINLGSALSEQGRVEEAKPLFEKALSISPGHAGALSSLARVAAAKGNMGEAMALVREAIAQDPRREDNHYVLAQLLRNEGRLGASVASFERALELAPERADIHFELAVVLAQSGRFQRAWQHVHFGENLGLSIPPAFRSALSAQFPEPRDPD